MIFEIEKNCFWQDIKPFEYGIAIGKAMGIAAVIAVVFYKSAWGLLIGIPIGIYTLKKWEKEIIKKKKKEFTKQFQDAMQSISASLEVGLSMENAIREAESEMKALYSEDAMISKEFQIMIRQMHLQVGMEQIMEQWAERVDIEDVRIFANVFALAKRMGGDMKKIIQKSIGQIQDKLEIYEEIETSLTAKKYEFKIMSMIPFGMVLYMRMSFPGFMDLLYGNLFGVVVMSLCLAIYSGAYLLGNKIVDIEI